MLPRLVPQACHITARSEIFDHIRLIVFILITTMPITFDSVGNIISLSLLIEDVIKTQDDSRGASAEYQAVIRELRSLDHALLEAELLFQLHKQTAQLMALIQTAENSTA